MVRKSQRSFPSPWTRAGAKRRGQYEEKRSALLRAAARLFVTEGFHNTSVTRLASSLGVTKPTLYYYLKDKDDILFQCLELAANRVIGFLDEVRASDATALQSMERFLRQYIEAVIADEFVRCFILVEEATLSTSSLRRIHARKRQINDSLVTLIRRGLTDGSIVAPNPVVTSFVLFGSANWIARWYRPGGNLTASQVADLVIAALVEGLTLHEGRRAEEEAM